MHPLHESPAGPTVIGGSNKSVTAPADTAENALATLAIPALKKYDRLRVSFGVSHTDGADDKTLKVKLGTTAFLTKLTTTGVGYRASVEIINKEATNSQTGDVGVTGTVETKNGATLTITGTKETGADSLVLTDYLVELIQLSPRKMIN